MTVNKAGLRKGLGTIDHIHTLWQVIQKTEEYKRPLCLAFVDYEKAYDSVETWAVLRSLQRCWIVYRYIQVFKCLYENTTMSVRIQEQTTRPIHFQCGVRQGDVISPKLFTAALEDVFKLLDWNGLGININILIKSHASSMPQSEYWPFSRSNDVEDKNVGGESSVLQKQVGLMESEVKEIQMELAAMKRNRICLSSRKQMEPEVLRAETDSIPFYKNVIKSQDEVELINKPPQISTLREELIRAKNAADEERFLKETYERKLKDLETKINSICRTGVVEETRKFPNDEVVNLKKQLRNMREEIEELKITASEKTDEVQEYRIKYIQAQQQVEELKRQIDIIEMDNKQVSDQIQIEIQRMKMQFQEKLQELAPLPDLLKGAQIQLQEARQLQKLAEDSSSQLSDELNRVNEKLVIAVNNLNAEKADRIKLAEENNTLKAEADMRRTEIEGLFRNVDDFKSQVLRLEEKLSQLDLRYQEKATECAQLVKDLDELREESNRSLARSKERAESMRRYMQTQVSELERQLIQTRAQCRTFQKERDDVRQRMQIQVNNLQENFDLVELRLRALQNQVASLKNSYAIILSDDDEDLQKSPRHKECLQA